MATVRELTVRAAGRDLQLRRFYLAETPGHVDPDKLGVVSAEHLLHALKREHRVCALREAEQSLERMAWRHGYDRPYFFVPVSDVTLEELEFVKEAIARNADLLKARVEYWR